MRPERPYRALRALVGTGVIFGVTGLWALGKLGYVPELGTMWDVIILGLVLASGYAVYGEATMTNAMDDAQEFTGTETEGDDEIPDPPTETDGGKAFNGTDFEPTDNVEQHLEAGE